MKQKYTIYVYEYGGEYLYELIEEDNAETALLELISAINRYGAIRVRWSFTK